MYHVVCYVCFFDIFKPASRLPKGFTNCIQCDSSGVRRVNTSNSNCTKCNYFRL